MSRAGFSLILKLVAIFFSLSILFTLCFTYTQFSSTSVALVYLNQLPIGIIGRVSNPDFKPSDQELECQRPQSQPPPLGPIPKTVHYVILSPEGINSTLTFPTFLSIKATLSNIIPDRIKIHCYDMDTEGEWFKRISHRVELVYHERNRPLGPQGHGIADYLLAHQADILRLHVVQDEGGIYLDTDMFPLKSFDDFLNSPNNAILGHEGANRYGLCNAVIIARQQSRFLRTWIDHYETFDDSSWNFHSVRLPKILATENAEDLCTVSPVAFFWPTWTHRHVEMMHEPLSNVEASEVSRSMAKFNGSLYENQYAFHAWGGAAWVKYLSKLTPEKLMEEDTRFNVLMRRVYTSPD